MGRPEARSADLEAQPLGQGGSELPQWVTREAGLEARLGRTQGHLTVPGPETQGPLWLVAALLPLLTPTARMPLPQGSLTHPTLRLLPRV